MTPFEWMLLAYGVVVTILFVIVVATVDEQREEIHRLRLRIHPGSRYSIHPHPRKDQNR